MLRRVLFIFFLFFISCSDPTPVALSNDSRLLKIALSKMGAPYRYGAAGDSEFDCSGFVYWVYKKAGITLPRTAKEQSQIGVKIPKESLKPGDLVFFDTSKRVFFRRANHSGIYLGDGKFIHASSGKVGSVTISSLKEGFYKDKFLWGVSKEEIERKFGNKK